MCVVHVCPPQNWALLDGWQCSSFESSISQLASRKFSPLLSDGFEALKKPECVSV